MSAIIPAVVGLRFDGIFLNKAAQFTDLEDGSPAYGNTFVVSLDRCTAEDIRRERDNGREIYRQAAKDAQRRKAFVA